MNANEIKFTFFQKFGVFTEIYTPREKMQAQIDRFVDCKIKAQVYDTSGKLGEIRPMDGKWAFVREA